MCRVTHASFFHSQGRRVSDAAMEAGPKVPAGMIETLDGPVVKVCLDQLADQRLEEYAELPGYRGHPS